MGRIVFDLTLGLILLFGLGYFACWRLFFKVGKAVDSEVTKIKNEAHRGEEEK